MFFDGKDGIVYPRGAKSRFLVLDDHGRQLVIEAFAYPASAFPIVWPILHDALSTVSLAGSAGTSTATH